MPIPKITPYYGDVVKVFPASATGTTVTAGGADAYGAAAEVAAAGDITTNKILESIAVDTPAVAVEPIKLEIGYGAGPTYICEVEMPLKTDVGTHMRADLLGRGGLIPSGSAISVRAKTATGGTTMKVHVGVMNVP